MKSLSLVVASLGFSFLLAGCTADVADADVPATDTDETSAAATALRPNGPATTLYASPAGLQGCERVLKLSVRSVLLPTYPSTTVTTGTLTSAWEGCTVAGHPEPVPETFALTALNLGCGSKLLRGTLASGRSVEIFDHQDATGGRGCGRPSENPVIARVDGRLWYAPKVVALATEPGTFEMGATYGETRSESGCDFFHELTLDGTGHVTIQRKVGPNAQGQLCAIAVVDPPVTYTLSSVTEGECGAKRYAAVGADGTTLQLVDNRDFSCPTVARLPAIETTETRTPDSLRVVVRRLFARF
ncbi:MAG: hypothetical protein U0169_05255 [Polyangiaceae bacterium]